MLKLDFRQIGTCSACSVFDMDALLLFRLPYMFTWHRS
jgi:hypothetical protein